MARLSNTRTPSRMPRIVRSATGAPTNACYAAGSCPCVIRYGTPPINATQRGNDHTIAQEIADE